MHFQVSDAVRNSSSGDALRPGDPDVLSTASKNGERGAFAETSTQQGIFSRTTATAQSTNIKMRPTPPSRCPRATARPTLNVQHVAAPCPEASCAQCCMARHGMQTPAPCPGSLRTMLHGTSRDEETGKQSLTELVRVKPQVHDLTPEQHQYLPHTSTSSQCVMQATACHTAHIYQRTQGQACTSSHTRRRKPVRERAKSRQIMAALFQSVTETCQTLAETCQRVAEMCQSLAEPSQTMEESIQRVVERSQIMAETCKILAYTCQRVAAMICGGSYSERLAEHSDGMAES